MIDVYAMNGTPWLLLLYSLPAKSGSARVNIWRKVKKTGALPFKSSSYLLPNRPELLERFQWLAQQIQESGGEATVAQVAALEGVPTAKVALQFNDARGAEYQEVIAALKERLTPRRGGRDEGPQAELDKWMRRFEEIRGVDYFDCPVAKQAASWIKRAMDPSREKTGKALRPVLSPRQFNGKTWLTRPRPAIDRVGSAWLIHRHIDPEARFVFAHRPEECPGAIPFDMTGVEFTHHGEDCTFENLLRRFGLKDKTLSRIGEMIHDADLEDGRFQTVEAIGLCRVFTGWARLGVTDEEILQRGMPCFDALYADLQAKP
jgi:hypothetical protein